MKRISPAPETADELLALDEALSQLATTDPKAAELVKLRYFAGLYGQQAAEILGMSPRSRRPALGVRPCLALPEDRGERAGDSRRRRRAGEET